MQTPPQRSPTVHVDRVNPRSDAPSPLHLARRAIPPVTASPIATLPADHRLKATFAKTISPNHTGSAARNDMPATVTTGGPAVNSCNPFDRQRLAELVTWRCPGRARSAPRSRSRQGR